MPCPNHHFVPNNACPLCRAFYGGFVHGVKAYPFKIYSGVKGLTPEDAERTSKELSIVSRRLFGRNLKEDAQDAKDLYDDLPEGVRSGIKLGAAREAGSLASGMLIGGLLSAFAGRAAANFAVFRLGAMHGPHASRAASIVVGGTLTYLSIVGAVSNFQRQTRVVLEEVPGGMEKLDEALDEMKKHDDSKPGR